MNQRQRWLTKRYPLNYTCSQCGNAKQGADTAQLAVCTPCRQLNLFKQAPTKGKATP